MLEWLVYAGVGRLLIFLAGKFSLPQRLQKIEWLEKLHSCDLCLGVWVYVFLAIFLNVDLLTLWFGFYYVPVLSEIVTGGVTSYIVWLLVIGFREAHLNVTII